MTTYVFTINLAYNYGSDWLAPEQALGAAVSISSITLHMSFTLEIISNGPG